MSVAAMMKRSFPTEKVNTSPGTLVKMLKNSVVNAFYFLLSPTKLPPVACVLVVLEIIINVAVINYRKYTEIDWRAYMQEVEGVLNGTFDYSHLKGDTGPLVYPAGFVWIFSGLYTITNRGENIRLAQYIFAGFYILNLILVLRIYIKTLSVPPYVLILQCLTSYRIHSIFILRLFNDPVAIILLYISINAFLDSRWSLGSFFFSLAVSVKMNILLFAPALLLIYLHCLGFKKTIQQLVICAGLQVVVALPFLVNNPVNYILGAFNLGRVFLYKWTVNWRFLPEHVFVDKRFHVSLLLIHFTLLVVFYNYSSFSLKLYDKLKKVKHRKHSKPDSSLRSAAANRFFLLPLFVCNFIGMTCSRSLHYQFYIWYFHSLPFLIWSTHYSITAKLTLLGIIEMCWNTYPSTSFSSISLHLCHLGVLYGLFKGKDKLFQQVSSLLESKQMKNK